MRRHFLALASIAAFGAMILPARFAAAALPDVLPGFDLLQTTDGTSLTLGSQTIPLVGVPIGSYDFGGGLAPTDLTDTIVQRLQTATGPSATVNTQLVDLQLVTPAPTSIGGGPTGLYYVTTQSQDNAGPPSTGNITINFDNSGNSGTFNSFFDVFFDVHFGALNGPIVYQSDLTLGSSDNAWNRLPPAGSVTIPGVNINLNGKDNSEDFWPGPIVEMHPNGGVHAVMDATVPEPASIALIIFAGVGILLRRRH